MPYPTLPELFAGNRGITGYQGPLLRLSRYAAPFLAWLAIRLKISPFHINYATFLLALCMCGTFALGPPDLRVTAAVLLLFWQLLDATDGAIARGLGIRSNYGGFVDLLGGMFLLAFLDVSIGLGLYRFPDHSMQQLLDLMDIHFIYLPVYSLIAGAYSSIAAILFRLTSRIIQLRFGIDMNERSEAGATAMSLKVRLRRVIQDVEQVGGLKLIILFIAAVMGQLEVFVVFYFVVQVVVLLGSTARALIGLRHQHAYR
jgi:phosphatidylglycerophosphate synthase